MGNQWWALAEKRAIIRTECEEEFDLFDRSGYFAATFILVQHEIHQ